MQIHVCPTGRQGFSLVEMMIALVILTFGLLSAGQLLCVAAGTSSLARSKGTAALAARNVLESLSCLYEQNPLAADLSLGFHSPRQTVFTNPGDATVLNRYNVNWVVESVPDPRAGKTLNARRVRAIAIPIAIDGNDNVRTAMNKALSIVTIFSPRMRRWN
jgi:prepilin-type N-terminal cleavage/methylation domain-containing protein